MANNYQGLSEAEAIKLRKEFGQNVISLKEGDSWFFILINQLKSPLIYILVAIAALSAIFGKYMDVLLIGFVVILNSAMGFFQEYKAQKTLIALRRILKPTALVIRDGRQQEIEISQLVPGDLVVLGSGDKIPADGVLKEAVNLLVNEAILTGEEEAVEKSLNDEENEIFMGTTVLAGRALMTVTKTGAKTEMGKIQQSLAQIKEEKTPIQVKLEAFSKELAKLILIICLLILLIGLAYGTDFLEMLRFSIILIIAAIPEGLPVAITIILALGMGKILKRNGLVKKLISIETLGASSVICTDKTGTLTEGNMRVVRTDYADKKMALEAIALANNQRTNIELALWQHVQDELKLEAQDIIDNYERIYEEPFDSHKKYILTINGIEGRQIGFLVGAPEIILGFCKNLVHEKSEILKKIDDWADEGLKIIGLAFKSAGNLKAKSDFVWLGLIGIQDPLRPEAKEAIRQAQEAGIKVKIVTGDYRKTAERIAINLGFDLKPKNVIEGQELEKLSEADLAGRISDLELFVRVTPLQKQRIVNSLQQKGEIVAMTGDGVNDAPALKKANIGVVLGTGSEVAKESGDLILLDNNFKTIIAAIEEGRTIFANIKKVVTYILSNSFVEIFLIFGSLLLRLPYPLTIAQILWIHLICDGPPDIMLCFEKKERNAMKEKPQNLQKESILSTPHKFLIISISLTVGLVCLAFFWLHLKANDDLDLARTLVFAAVAAVDLIYVFSFKNLGESIFKSRNFFQNKFLIMGVFYGFVLTLAAIYVPLLNKLLGTVPLKPIYWLFVFGVGIMSMAITEIFKFAYFSAKK
ncbi:MAG: ATPase, P-type (Transporting), HAD superfamily, subfamily IC [Parcubacteria group bacterium GW2011_GWC2_42_6]|nr:MAG: ATPase, P-type (Transporting), HAD superfamily, subfamily IC [Parcubacteria group bacterium GW2011_GWC2_42_6]KKT76602.1 MAG: ATPase, P-type (Transporting), HAD superfamily, subfamily IC [Parcubacteria group bacterium GW2011_GWF2_44_7]